MKVPDVGQVWIPDFMGPYHAVIPPDLWNGFLCPLFDWDTVKRMAKDTVRLARHFSDDEVTIVKAELWRGRRIVTMEYTNPDYTDHVDPVGDLYPIGSWGWAWERYPVNR